MFTLRQTNSSQLKMDGWKMRPSFWEPGLCAGANLLASFSGRVIPRNPWREHDLPGGNGMGKQPGV